MESTSPTLTSSILQRFPTLANLQALHQELLLDTCELRLVPAHTVLFKLGAEDPLEFFLVEGSVQLTARDGKQRTIEAGTAAANHPLSRLRPHQYGALTVTPVRYFTVEALVLKELIETCSTEMGRLQEHAGVQLDYEASRLLASFEEDLSNGKFVLPAMPEVALRLRKKLQDPDLDLGLAARLIGTEPAMAARIVQAANSPLYRRGTPCASIQNAIMRLGMHTTRQLIMSLLLRDVFISKDPMLKQRWQRSWHESVAVASTCCVLAKRTMLFSVEDALLAGLVHLIGDVAILSYAQQFPAILRDENYLNKTLCSLRAVAGRSLLQSWNFPPALVSVAAQSYDSNDLHDGPAELSDLVSLARHLTLDERAFFVAAGTGTDGAMAGTMAGNMAQGLPASRYFPKIELSAAGQLEIARESRELLTEIGQLLF